MQAKYTLHPSAGEPQGRVRARRRPQADSVERTLQQVGDHWTFLILREAFFGVRRFDELQCNLSAAPSVLSQRLRRLVAHGILERVRYQERPPRSEYRLTDKGLDLYPVIVLMMRWGDRWLDGGRGAPLRLRHLPCGHDMRPHLTCDGCGAPVEAREVEWRRGRGA